MRQSITLASLLVLVLPGCALIDGITGDDEEVVLPPECDPYCFVTIIGVAGDGTPTAMTTRDDPFDFLIGSSDGEIVIVSPQDAESGGFSQRLTTTPSPVVDIAAGSFDGAAQRDIATSFLLSPGDFQYPIFFNNGTNVEIFSGDAAPIGDIGLTLTCDARDTFGDELLTFQNGVTHAWDIMAGMPAPGGTSVMAANMEPVAAACGDFEINGADDVAILSKDAMGDRLIVFLNDGGAGIGTDPGLTLIAPLPPQSGRNTEARTLRYNEKDNLIAVGFACDDCNQPWSIIREYEVIIDGTPQIRQADAVEFVAPFDTLDFTTGDFDGDGGVDYAVAGAPLGPGGPEGPPPNLLLLFNEPSLLPHPIQIFNPSDTTDVITQIEAGPVNGDNRDDIALLTSIGGGRQEVQYLLTTDEPPMGPPPNN